MVREDELQWGVPIPADRDWESSPLSSRPRPSVVAYRVRLLPDGNLEHRRAGGRVISERA
jgi:hypothetical protein